MKHLFTLILLTFFIANNSLAGTEPVNNRLQGADLYDLKGSATTFDLSDNKYWMMADGTWDSEFTVKSVQNKIILGIDESDLTYIAGNYAYRVELAIDYEALAGDELLPNSIENIFLEVNYNALHGSVYQDRAVYSFAGGLDVQVAVVNIEKLIEGEWVEVVSSTLPSALFLEQEIITERYYPFDQTIIPSSSTSIAAVPGELEVAWPFIEGAEEYELEWTWVNGYSGETLAGEPVVLGATELNYNFGLNATRVRLKGKNTYSIPLIYGEGYILIRYRGIGRGGADFSIPLEGRWNSDGFAASSGTVASFGSTGINYLQVNSHTGDDLNYGAGMSFIENGVHSVGVTYMDGVLKPRQSQAKLNSQEKIIAGSTIYDHYGRPAIGVMSTPVDQTTLGYVDNLNMHSDGTVYAKEHFDLDAADVDCGDYTAAPPMSSELSSGAANYYSEDNPDQEGANAYLPDSDGYPFVQVHYANDPTGRIKRVGGLGPDHQLGETSVDGTTHNAHYTEYFYTTPDSTELFALFGNDVIDAQNYTKVISKDVHGQISTAIIDPMGRTIATYMSGAAPSGLETIEGNDGLSPTSKDLMAYNYTDALIGEVVVEHPLMVVDPTVVYDFTYDFTAASYSECLPVESLCLDCIYDVTITITPLEFNSNCRITDEANTNIDDDETGIVTLTYTVGSLEAFDPTTCVDPLTFSGENGLDASQFSVIFPKIGEYNIKKTLKVATAPLDYYWELYKENSTCLLTEADFLEDAISYIDPSDCEDLTPCEFAFLLDHGTLEIYLAADPLNTETSYNLLKTEYLEACGTQNSCDVLEPFLMADLGSGGQYDLGALYATGPDAASIAILSALNAPLNISDIVADHGPFYEEDGVTIATFDLDGDGFFEATVSDLTLAEFGSFYNDTWAINFIELHPEYCYFSFCADNSDLFEFEHQMLSVDAYADACALGLVNPFAPSHAISHLGCSANEDPIYTGIPAGVLTEINALVTEEYTLDDGSVLSIYEMAVYLSGQDPDVITFGSVGCDQDRHWQIFRSLYLSKRFQIIDILKDDYVTSGSCSDYAKCIGSADVPCGGTIFETSIPRYFNFENSFFDLDTPGMDWDAEAADAEIVIDEICLDQCSALADEWMSQLEGCTALLGGGESWEVGQVTYDIVRAKLIEVCAGGCDSEWPLPLQVDLGATFDTSDPDQVNWTFTSFEEVIETYLGAETVDCSHLLITYPAPTDGSESLINYLDDCGCNALMSSSSLEDFEITYGFTPVDYTYEKCTCESYDDGTGGASAGDGVLSPSEAAILLADNVQSANDYPCGSNCVDCSTIGSYKSNFTIEYGETYLTESALFTSYVNAQTNGNYTFEQLTHLIENCDAIAGPIGSPVYHLLDPKTTEIRDLLNKLASGGLTNDQLDLNLLDIPEYLNSTLYPCGDEDIAEFDYLPTVSTTLSFDLTNSTCDGACSFTLSIPGGVPAGFASTEAFFANIESFGTPYLLTTIAVGALDHYYVLATVNHPDGGSIEQEIRLDNSCYDFITEHYTTAQGAVSFQICTGQFEAEEEDCLDLLIENAENAASDAYDEYLAIKEAEFRADYINKCSLIPDESFLVDYQSNNYHYTLLYYDQSGNLVQTIPPKGVNKLEGLALENALNYASEPDSYAPAFPSHDFETTYKHNSLNQVVAVNTPDGGTNNYFYDYIGRLVISQNAKQVDFETGLITNDPESGTTIPAYSYTLYDELGRVTEVGEIIHPTTMTKAIAKDPALLEDWINTTMVGAQSVIRNNVTQMHYDDDFSIAAAEEFGEGGYGFTRNRIVATSVITDYIYPTDGEWIYPEADYTNHYRYDIHGNVETYLQEINALDDLGQTFRSVDYEYDLISGNPNYIYYQKNKPDQYIHHYIYDKDNRLQEVFTSAQGQIWDRDVNYEYREDGYLARTEIGEMKVQGLDYAYTLHGWLKTLNSGVLNADYDMGRDGRRDGATEYSANENEVHGLVAKDALSYTIGYYQGDYTAVSDGTSDYTNMMLDISSGSAFDLDKTDLYNGNITSLVTNLTDFNGDKLNVQANTYHYDQLHRFKDMHVFSPNTDGNINATNSLATATRKNLETFSITESDGTAGTRSLGDYEVHVDYDQNGNITSLIRMSNQIMGDNLAGTATTDNGMDEFSYIYEANTNKLTQVTDNNDNEVVTIGADPVALGDIKDGQLADNYTYHANGALKSDLDEEIAYIDWYPSGKIKRIFRTSSSEQSDIYFEYDPMGMRTLKVEMTRTGTTINTNNLWKYTYYACDANGIALAVYKLDLEDQDNTLQKSESMLYGGSRLGMDVAPVTVAGNFAESILDKCNTDGTSSSVIQIGPMAPVDGITVGVALNGSLIANIAWSGSDILANTIALKAEVDLLENVSATIYEVDAGFPTYYLEVSEDVPGTLSGTITYQIDGAEHAPSLLRENTIGECYETRVLGLKYYELTNHLGNVMEVVSDRKIAVDENTYDAVTGDFVSTTSDLITDWYEADVVQYSDYYPYGMAMSGRNGSVAETYRYAFNGMEADGEVSGSGNSYTTQFRQYDPRLGRWKSLDPLAAKFPWQSPFNGMDDNPIKLTDPLGLSTNDKGDRKTKRKAKRKAKKRARRHKAYLKQYAKDNGIDDYSITYNAQGGGTLHYKDNTRVENVIMEDGSIFTDKGEVHVAPKVEPNAFFRVMNWLDKIYEGMKGSTDMSFGIVIKGGPKCGDPKDVHYARNILLEIEYEDLEMIQDIISRYGTTERALNKIKKLNTIKIKVEKPSVYRNKAYMNMDKNKSVTGQGKYTDPIKRWKADMEYQNVYLPRVNMLNNVNASRLTNKMMSEAKAVLKLKAESQIRDYQKSDYVPPTTDKPGSNMWGVIFENDTLYMEAPGDEGDTLYTR